MHSIEVKFFIVLKNLKVFNSLSSKMYLKTLRWHFPWIKMYVFFTQGKTFLKLNSELWHILN